MQIYLWSILMETKMQETSLLAHQEIKSSLGDRQLLVYRTIKAFGSCNSTMIARGLSIPINCIVPRVNELRKMGYVVQDKKSKCPFTNKLTIFWSVGGSIDFGR